MPTPPRVSAIVSTFQSQRFIRGCLEDLFDQTLFHRGELEILVIDSASPQNEGAIVAEFTARAPDRVRYLRTPTRETVYGAWNRGVALARAPYLTNTNTDDRHHPHCLQRLADALDAHPAASGAYADSIVTRDENVPFAQAQPFKTLAWPDFDRDCLFEFCYLGPHPLWRKSLHQRYGLFDAHLRSAGDYEFWLRLAAAGETFLHVTEPLSLYLENPQSISLSNIDLSWEESEAARDRHWNPAWGVPPKFRHAQPFYERLAQRIAALPAGSRIALYGAGKHTRKMLPLFRQAAGSHAQLAGILDDHPGDRRDIDGLPVIPASDWRTLSPAAIIVSSDAHESAMAAKLATIVTDNIKIWRVYNQE